MLVVHLIQTVFGGQHSLQDHLFLSPHAHLLWASLTESALYILMGEKIKLIVL